MFKKSMIIWTRIKSILGHTNRLQRLYVSKPHHYKQSCFMAPPKQAIMFHGPLRRPHERCYLLIIDLNISDYNERIPEEQEKQPGTSNCTGLPLPLRPSTRRKNNAGSQSERSNFLRVYHRSPSQTQKAFQNNVKLFGYSSCVHSENYDDRLKSVGQIKLRPKKYRWVK